MPSPQSALPDATALSDCRQGGTEEIAGVATTIYEYMPPSFGGEAPQAQKLWMDELAIYGTREESEGREELGLKPLVFAIVGAVAHA